MRRPLALLVAVALTAVPAIAGAQARTVRVTSASGVQHVAAVLLPKSYATSAERRYPVVYLFPGNGQDHTAYMARNAFRAAAAGMDIIVVMSAADRSYSARGAEDQAAYHDFVATELVDFVDAQYRTIASREARAIGGLSMGGRIATMTALAHPDRFALVGGFSPALRADARAALDGIGDRPAPYFYLSCGTTDSLLGVNREFAAQLDEHKVPHEYHEAQGQGHEWAFWDPEIVRFLELAAARTTPLLQAQ